MSSASVPSSDAGHSEQATNRGTLRSGLEHIEKASQCKLYLFLLLAYDGTWESIYQKVSVKFKVQLIHFLIPQSGRQSACFVKGSLATNQEVLNTDSTTL